MFHRFVISSHSRIQRNCYPCLARLSDDRLLVVWSATMGKGHCIVGAFSADHGVTWSKPATILDSGTGRDYDPSIVVSGSRVFVTSTTVPAGGSIRTSTTWCVRSEDNGNTWSRLYEIPMNHRYTCGKTARGIRLKSGTLLFGYSWDVLCEQGRTLKTEGEMHLRAGVMRSLDNGDTWENGGDTDATYEKASGGAVRGTDEPSLVELDDGSIYMLMRTGSRHLYEARSFDEGRTWTGVGPSPLRGTNAPCALSRFRVAGRHGILCVWDNGRTRYPLCAAASFDGGRTWTQPKDLAGSTGGKQASYPGCAQAADGTLVAVWQQDVPGGRDLRGARFTLDWLREDPAKERQRELSRLTLPAVAGRETRFTGARLVDSSVWEIHRPQGVPRGGRLTPGGLLRMEVNGCYHIDDKPSVWDGSVSNLIEFRMRVLGRAPHTGADSAAEVWLGGPQPMTGCRLFFREDAVTFTAGYLPAHRLDATQWHTYRVWTNLTTHRAYLFVDDGVHPVLATKLTSPEGFNLNRILVGDSSGGPDVAGTSEWDYVAWRPITAE